MSVPAAAFALHETLEAVPDVQFEIEHVVAHESDRVMPLVWATAVGTDREILDKALATDPSVENVDELAAFDDEWLYRMKWVENVQVVLHTLLEQQGVILNADGRDDEWHLRMLFPDRESLSATYDFCQKENLSITVKAIYELDSEHRDRYGLTDTQHETLIMAVEKGYFDIPQETTLDDLAAELDISHQALSERLHRGHKTLIESTLILGRTGE